MRVPIRIASHSKYHARRTEGYASAKEARYASDLKALAKMGQIENLAEQVRFELLPKNELGRAISYVADFCFDDKVGHHVIDCKGFRTPVYKLKRRLMFHVHGIKIEEV